MSDPMSINEAARLTGLSIPTIRAKLDKGLLPNAKKVKQGKRNSWQIPLNDLLNADLVKAQPDKEETERIAELESKVRELTKDLDHTKELLEKVEQDKAELRKDYRMFLAQLERPETIQARRETEAKESANQDQPDQPETIEPALGQEVSVSQENTINQQQPQEKRKRFKLFG